MSHFVTYEAHAVMCSDMAFGRGHCQLFEQSTGLAPVLIRS